MAHVINYFIKFFSVTVVACLEPVNWESCRHVDQWLFPEIQNGIEILRNPDIPYKTERDYLESVVNSKVNINGSSNE